MGLTKPWVRIACWFGAVTAIALATAAYFRPDFVVDLANQIMLCF